MIKNQYGRGGGGMVVKVFFVGLEDVCRHFKGPPN